MGRLDMHAAVGDVIVVDGRHLGERRRTGRVVEVRGQNGEPPYRVEWEDTGRATLFFPSYDCRVEPAGEGVAS